MFTYHIYALGPTWLSPMGKLRLREVTCARHTVVKGSRSRMICLKSGRCQHAQCLDSHLETCANGVCGYRKLCHVCFWALLKIKLVWGRLFILATLLAPSPCHFLWNMLLWLKSIMNIYEWNSNRHNSGREEQLCILGNEICVCLLRRKRSFILK